MAATELVAPNGFSGFDDAEIIGNGGEPSAALMGRCIEALNSIAAGGRLVRTFWGSGSNDAEFLRRTLWNHKFRPANRIDSMNLVVLPGGAMVSGQRLAVNFNGLAAGGAFVTDYERHYDLSNGTARTEPTGVEIMRTSDAETHTENIIEMSIGSVTSNGPKIVSGMIFEPARFAMDPTIARTYTPSDHVGPGYAIVSGGIGTSKSILDTFRLNYLHVWNRKRPEIGWEKENAGTGTVNVNYTEFGEPAGSSPTAYRYVHAQAVGDGGTAPSATGPAITFPLYKCGSGINTTIRVAVYVYAWMSGATDTGSIGISHKDGVGGMTSIAALTNPATISGATPQWYPASNATPATFLARTDVDYERILLCGRSSGSTNRLRIGGFVMWPIHSDTIT